MEIYSDEDEQSPWLNDDSYGQLILDALGPEAAAEQDQDGEPCRPYLGCKDAGEWAAAVDSIMDRILRDRHFEVEQHMMLLPVQDRIQRMREWVLGLESDYYSCM